MGSTHAADIAMSVLRCLIERNTLRDSFKLPTHAQLWLNWPPEEHYFVAWEFFSGSGRWSHVMANVGPDVFVEGGQARRILAL